MNERRTASHALGTTHTFGEAEQTLNAFQFHVCDDIFSAIFLLIRRRARENLRGNAAFTPMPPTSLWPTLCASSNASAPSRILYVGRRSCTQGASHHEARTSRGIIDQPAFLYQCGRVLVQHYVTGTSGDGNTGTGPRFDMYWSKEKMYRLCVRFKMIALYSSITWRGGVDHQWLFCTTIRCMRIRVLSA